MKNLVTVKKEAEGRDKSLPPMIMGKETPRLIDTLTSDKSCESTIHSDVAEYGIDLQKIREVERMFNLKQERQALTTKQKETRKELIAARSLFEMDQFVKLSEVKAVMKEALTAIVDKMQKADAHARANAATLSAMNVKVKAL